MTPKHLLPLSLFVLAACGGGSKPAPEPTPDPTPASCDATGLSVTLLSPTGPVTTRGVVPVALAISGQVDRVDLMRDGLVLATLTAPYTFEWDTASVAEGTYQLLGRATCGTTRVTSAIQPVVVDRTPPSLTERSPAPGAEVAAGGAIRLDFSEPLLPSSVTADSLALKVDGQHVEASVALSPDGRTLTLTPAQPLVAPASAEVTLTDALTDGVGNAVVPPAPWTFSVPRWLDAQGAVTLAAANERFAQPPILQLDTAGRPALVFRVASGPTGAYAARTSRWTGSAWTPLVDSGGSGSLAVAFAMGKEDRIMLSDLRDVGGWRLDLEYHTPRRTPASDFIFNCESPVAAVGPRGLGVVAAAYAISRVPPFVILVEGFGDNGQVEFPDLPGAHEDEDQRLPALAMDAEDRPVVAWLDERGAIAVARWKGTFWELLGTRLPTQGLSGEPTLRVDAQGRFVLAWREVEGSESRVRLHRFTTGDWSAMASPSGVAPPPAAAPSLAMDLDAEGNPVLAWTEAGSPAKVRVMRYSGSGWTSLDEVSRAGVDVLVGRGGLELDGRGQPVLATAVRAAEVSDVRVWRVNRLEP
ncbi:Ig-like domain-containing protein [Pyxidicoccus sp. MSG2]|uniref:Ig-like domain-containing protein n=1 Tax=Pyxidicoccus sp. MSG2 TaxID=2996790 RepID=UPI00226EB494|nr:Ig-like domain-containing protein [Pyxidicoccus sp. MSG2]MCY1019446.1 Ig-like domain-containing protein [Pyxidicoccus sp. MSG2]